MSNDEPSAAALSRALFLGASLGTLPLLQVGCAATPFTPATGGVGEWGASGASAPGAIVLCARALETRDPAAVEELLRSYPSAPCIVPTLDAMPRETLAQISPGVLDGLSDGVRNQIAPGTASHLRLPARTAAVFEPGAGSSS
jgi:hypothetical protein